MQETTAPDAPSETAGGQPEVRSQRLILRLACWVLVPLLLLALLVFVVPTYAARYVAGRQLESMGVTTEGINTLKIDVWNREVWLGPAQFRGEAAPFGRVEEIGVKLGVTNLFQRQALIRELLIKGVDLQLTREADGRLFLNGVDLRRQGQQEARRPVDEEGEPWGTGIDEVRIIDSRIFFTDRARGTLAIDVIGLELDEFRSWEPEHPGRFLLDATINKMGFRAKGTAKPFSVAASADAQLTVDAVEIEKIALYTGPLGFDRRSGVLRADLSTTVQAAGGNVEGTVKGEIVLRDADQSRPDQVALQFDEAVLLLDQAFRLEGDRGNSVEGPLKFSIKAANLGVPGGASVDLGSGDVELSSLRVKTDAGRTQIETNGSMQLTSVEAQSPAAGERGTTSMAASDIRTTGRNLRVDASGSGTDVAGALTIEANSLELAALQAGASPPMKVTAERAAVDLGSLAAKAGTSGPSVDARGAVDFDKLAAQIPGAGEKLSTEASADKLHVDLKEVVAGMAEPREWRVAFDAAIAAFAAAVGGGDVAKASLGGITLTGGRADQGMRIGAEDLSLAGVAVELTRALFPKPPAERAPTPADGEAAGPGKGQAQAPGLKLSLGRFALADSAKVSFTDGSVSPPVRMAVDIKTLQASNLNMEDPAQQTDMRLSAVVNGFSGVDASGWAMPFAPSPSFDILAQVRDLELPPLSPYAAQAVGVNIDGGRLNLKADAKAEQANLDGAVQIDLRGLAFGALSKEDEERLSAKVGVPINTVVSLLQDSEGKIDLRVPISGNLASPDFDLSDAIGQAVTGAVTGAVTAPFKLIFEPVNMIAGGGGSGLSLKPIPFAAGEALLTPEGRVFIDNLAKLLQQRPKLALRVCGKSTQQDVAALRARGALTPPGAAPQQAAGAPSRASAPQPDEQTRAELTRLAEERTRAVRQYLAERARIPAARIGECRAAFEPQGKGGPRAEASF